MMGRLPSLLQVTSDGRDRESRGCVGRDATGAAELVFSAARNHRELRPAVGVIEDDTAGGKSSSRPGVEGAPVRTLQVPAEVGFVWLDSTGTPTLSAVQQYPLAVCF